MGIGTIAGIIGAVGSVASAAAPYLSGGSDGGSVATPEAAQYEPVDFAQTQLDTIFDNTNALPSIKTLVNRTNTFITNDALKRADKLIPGYRSSMTALGGAANDFLLGRVPFEDVLDIVGNRSALTSSIGTPGTGTNATLRDLGMSRAGAIQQGSGLLGQMVNIAETVSPRSTYMNPQSMMLNPLDRIRLEMEQNQLIQQSQQNANNLEAIGQSNLSPSGGGNPAGAIGAGLGGISNILGSYASSPSSTSSKPNSSGYYSSPGAIDSVYGGQSGMYPVSGAVSPGNYYFSYYQPYSA